MFWEFDFYQVYLFIRLELRTCLLGFFFYVLDLKLYGHKQLKIAEKLLSFRKCGSIFILQN